MLTRRRPVLLVVRRSVGCGTGLTGATDAVGVAAELLEENTIRISSSAAITMSTTAAMTSFRFSAPIFN
jgi:hypothetical protein